MPVFRKLVYGKKDFETLNRILEQLPIKFGDDDKNLQLDAELYGAMKIDTVRIYPIRKSGRVRTISITDPSVMRLREYHEDYLMFEAGNWRIKIYFQRPDDLNL